MVFSLRDLARILFLKGKNVVLLRHLIPEIIIGYVFWSFFFGFGPAIWFYPLNELDITGYEVFLFILLIPAICINESVFRVLQYPEATCILRLTATFCLFAARLPTTFLRLVVMSIGMAASLLLLVVTLWSPSVYQRFITCWGLILGFLMMLVSRIACYSLVPAWANNFTNSLVIVLAFVSTLDRNFCGGIHRILSGHEALPFVTDSWECIRTPIGFGSLLYITHALFGEVSVLSRWTWSSYPDTGPSPTTAGIFVLIALNLGILLSVTRDPNITSEVWWAVGNIGLALMYTSAVGKTILFGLLFAIYVMSLWPIMIDRMAICPPGKTVTIAMATYIAEILFSIWTVAYNFVPLGTITREHTGVLLGFISLFLYLSICTGKVDQQSRTAFVRLSNSSTFYKNKSSIQFVIAWLFIIGMAGFSRRCPTVYESFDLRKYSKASVGDVPVNFSALIWTYHFGFDNTGLPSYEKSAKVLKETGAEVIALLESDASKPFLGNNDIALWLSYSLNMYSDFGPSTKDHTWGNLILSKYPIVKSQHHLLPSPVGELAPAISATLLVYGKPVDFVTAHMGNDRDNLDRELQAKYLAMLLNNSTNPVVFMGYVTSAPWSRDYNELIQKGRMKDIDETDMDRWCQYIMYRGLKRLGYARISHGGLSDTELQMASFEIPVNEEFDDNDVMEQNADNVPKEQLFSKKFEHNSTFAHHFHANTPKYFVAEETDE